MSSSIWGLARTHASAAPDSAVDFPTKTRFHIALNVKKVETALVFYETLFGCAPHTLREGYAKFDLREPPLNFSLNEVPKNARSDGRFGIETKSREVIHSMAARMRAAGIACAEQATESLAKLEVQDPEGNIWRIYSTHATHPVRSPLVHAPQSLS